MVVRFPAPHTSTDAHRSAVPGHGVTRSVGGKKGRVGWGAAHGTRPRRFLSSHPPHPFTPTQRHTFSEHFDTLEEAPKLAGHAVMTVDDVPAIAAYVADGEHRVKVVSFNPKKQGGETEEHFIGAVDNDGMATLYKDKDSTHPSGKIDLNEHAQVMSWPSRVKGAAKKKLAAED